MRAITFVQGCLAAAALLAGGVVAAAQTPPSTAPVVGSCNFSPIVADLDKAIAFYQGVLGLTVPAPPPGGRPFDSTSPVLDMLGVHGAEGRWVTARIPGSRCGVEIVEFARLARTPRTPRPQDPGASTLVLLVRAIDPILARAKAAGVPIVTNGGAPIAVESEGGTAILLRDPDGHFIELLQPSTPPATTAPAAAEVIGWRARIVVGSIADTLKLYRDQFALDVKPATPATNRAFTALNGVADVAVGVTTLNLPGGGRLDFAEFTGVDRTPIAARVQDPGATRFQLQASNAATTIDLAKKAGGTVISTGGALVPLGGGTQAAAVRDPNNLFLVIFSSAPRN
jgi:catechol 2,3-dioxygenase-like lactoylglutathione lyase family enzyme